MKKTNTYLDFDQTEISQKGGVHTAREIAGQPGLWQQVFDLILSEKEEISLSPPF